MTSIGPGWYHAEGDPPDTVRYWDGELWRGDPQPSGGAAPPPPATAQAGAPPPLAGMGSVDDPHPGAMPASPAFPTFPGQAMFTESSQATAALVLGILGIVCCGICSPFAWKLGQDEVNGIDAGRRDPMNRGTANAGRILGIIGTVILGLAVLYILFAVALAVGSA